MISLIRKITIVSAIAMILFLGYQALYVNKAKRWSHIQKPQEASYSKLEKDELVLQDLEMLDSVTGSKRLDPSLFDKPTIFQSIALR